MKDGQSSRPPSGQIDQPMLWFLARGAQVLLTVIFTKDAYLSLGAEFFVLDVASSIGMLLMIYLLLHRVVTGSADSSGIHYRRYFRLRSVAWEDIQEIQWAGSRLRVLIKGRSKRPKKLIFMLNPLKVGGPYLAHRLGMEVTPPEILARINALPIETPPKISSAPSLPKWIYWFFLGFTVFFVLVLLWRLFSASIAAPH